jgi:ppGpp synthetase/RelA/SpoT-type nucleotidyltranferase
MRFERYEQERALYVEFVAIVRLILEQTVATMGAPQPQSIQGRAKTVTSLKKKLADRGLLESDWIERQIKHLAGIRVIFSTNSDVDRFLNSRLIPMSFEVDWEEARTHHPTAENVQRRYQAFHYTVYLSSDRTRLPEYARFKGMRCEIQIQTILNHAWSETEHDILYKNPKVKGFGTKAFQSIERRMQRIMDEHLLPAGYELQKVQHDYERLMQGKALFDRGTLKTLAQCDNNNDRHDTLSGIREYVLPNYDDIRAIYGEVCKALLDAVLSARKSAPKPIELPFGTFPGKTAQDITKLALEILDELRYVDIDITFQSVVAMWRDEGEQRLQEQALRLIENLACYNVNVWRRVGPAVQHALAAIVASLSPGDRLDLRPVVLTVWRVLLSSEARGVSQSSADSVEISIGAVPASDTLAAIRARAIAGLLELWDQAQSVVERREAFSALMGGTHAPMGGSVSNDLRALILKDTRQILDALASRLEGKPFDLLQRIEYSFLLQYRRAREIANDEQDRLGCKVAARALMEAIIEMRDRLNADYRYVRYKTLVGFDSALPPHWQDGSFEYEDENAYRHNHMNAYVDAIKDETENEWYELLLACAATESSDSATFLVFADFLVQLARLKPAVAVRFVHRGDPSLRRFVPAFLTGLSQSGADAEYQALLARCLSEGKHLSEIAVQIRATKAASVDMVKRVLARALTAKDDIAVIECLALAVEQHAPHKRPLVRGVFLPAIRYLISRKDARWVSEVWWMSEGRAFFGSLSAISAGLILESLLELQRIDHHGELVLVGIAAHHPRAVWRFFKRRLQRKDDAEEGRYEAFPDGFPELHQPLGQDAELAVAEVRGWFPPRGQPFCFEGGRLLSDVFPTFPELFADKLLELVESGSEDDAEFVIAVMQNFHGEAATHGVLKALVDRLPEGDPRLEEVKIALEHSDGTCGEFGRVDLLRRKKEDVASWLDDPSARVRDFATVYTRNLDQSIASEQRAAQQRHELRKRDFGSDDDP